MSVTVDATNRGIPIVMLLLCCCCCWACVLGNQLVTGYLLPDSSPPNTGCRHAIQQADFYFYSLCIQTLFLAHSLAAASQSQCCAARIRAQLLHPFVTPVEPHTLHLAGILDVSENSAGVSNIQRQKAVMLKSLQTTPH